MRCFHGKSSLVRFLAELFGTHELCPVKQQFKDRSLPFDMKSFCLLSANPSAQRAIDILCENFARSQTFT